MLIVEDDAHVRDTLCDLMTLSGFSTVTAVDGLDALSVCARIKPDLILADIMMPGMDGLTLLSRIRAKKSLALVPVILLTADTVFETRIEGLEIGADDFLTKPFNARELVARVSNMIETRKKLVISVYSAPRAIISESQDEIFMRTVQDLFEAQIGDPSFNLDRAASELRLSRSSVQKRLRRLAGQSFNRYLREFRLERARQLIRDNTGTISDIAYHVGFNSLSYFSRCFKERYGHSPRQQDS